MITRHGILIRNKCSNMYCRYVRITWLVDRRTCYMIVETHFFDVWIGIRIVIRSCYSITKRNSLMFEWVIEYFMFINIQCLRIRMQSICIRIWFALCIRHDGGGGGGFSLLLNFMDMKKRSLRFKIKYHQKEVSSFGLELCSWQVLLLCLLSYLPLQVELLNLILLYFSLFAFLHGV